MTTREVAKRLPRTQAVADALAKWMQMGDKKPKRKVRSVPKEDSRQMPLHLTSPK